MLPAHAGERTQDFVLDTGKVFIAPGAKTFLAQITATEIATPLPEGVKAAVSTASRAANKVLHVVGLDSANLDFYGHPALHPLAVLDRQHRARSQHVAGRFAALLVEQGDSGTEVLL